MPATEKELMKRKVAELQQMCEATGVDTKGKKAELVSRLLANDGGADAMDEEEAPAAEEAAAAAEETPAPAAAAEAPEPDAAAAAPAAAAEEESESESDSDVELILDAAAAGANSAPRWNTWVNKSSEKAKGVRALKLLPPAAAACCVRGLPLAPLHLLLLLLLLTLLCGRAWR